MNENPKRGYQYIHYPIAEGTDVSAVEVSTNFKVNPWRDHLMAMRKESAFFISNTGMGKGILYPRDVPASLLRIFNHRGHALVFVNRMTKERENDMLVNFSVDKLDAKNRVVGGREFGVALNESGFNEYFLFDLVLDPHNYDWNTRGVTIKRDLDNIPGAWMIEDKRIALQQILAGDKQLFARVNQIRRSSLQFTSTFDSRIVHDHSKSYHRQHDMKDLNISVVQQRLSAVDETLNDISLNSF